MNQYIGNYIQSGLEILLIILIFRFLFTSIIQLGNNSLSIFTNKLTFVFILGLLLSIIVGFLNNKFPSQEANIDIQRIIAFYFFLISPLVFIKINVINKKSIVHIFARFAAIYSFLVSISFLYEGIGGSVLVGNLFGATTINITLLGYFSIYGLYYYYKFNKKLGLIIALIGWLVNIASLSKWAFIIDVTIPFILFKVYSERNKLYFGKGVLTYFVSAILIFLFIDSMYQIFNTFASNIGFLDFQSYLYSRVLRTQSSSDGGLFVMDSYVGLKDGARLLMWTDLLERTLLTPIWGLGLGTRALDYLSWNMEDHNIFVFFVSRFGVILFIFLFYLSFKIINIYYVQIKNRNDKLVRIIFSTIFINYFFQGSVGNVWGQIIVVLFVGILLTIMLKKSKSQNLKAILLK